MERTIKYLNKTCRGVESAFWVHVFLFVCLFLQYYFINQWLLFKYLIIKW